MELVMLKNGLICYHVIFAEYERRWIDTVSAARLRVIANFCFVEVCCCCCCCCCVLRSLKIETWRINNVI